MEARARKAAFDLRGSFVIGSDAAGGVPPSPVGRREAARAEARAMASRVTTVPAREAKLARDITGCGTVIVQAPPAPPSASVLEPAGAGGPELLPRHAATARHPEVPPSMERPLPPRIDLAKRYHETLHVRDPRALRGDLTSSHFEFGGPGSPRSAKSAQRRQAEPLTIASLRPASVMGSSDRAIQHMRSQISAQHMHGSASSETSRRGSTASTSTAAAAAGRLGRSGTAVAYVEPSFVASSRKADLLSSHFSLGHGPAAGDV